MSVLLISCWLGESCAHARQHHRPIIINEAAGQAVEVRLDAQHLQAQLSLSAEGDLVAAFCVIEHIKPQ